MDNNTCFYVGKGKGRRYKELHRNSHHDRIISKCDFITIIIMDELTEEQAFDLEKMRIQHYVFDLGYGIDINGYRKNNTDKQLTNSTFGGEGTSGLYHSDEWKRQHSEAMKGKNNPMYRVDMFHSLPLGRQMEIRRSMSEKNTGDKNPMFGISPEERMSQEVYDRWLLKMKNRNFSGEHNPNYNNTTLHNKVKDNPELRKQYYARPKEQNGRAREIYVYDSNYNYILHFNYIGACAEWFKEVLSLQTKSTTIRQNIITSITQNKLYHNHKFSYVKL